MIDKKISNRIYLLHLTISLSFLSTVVLLATNNKPPGYQFFWVLPLTFGVSILLSKNIRKKIISSKVITIVYFTYFIKSVIVPILTLLGNYRVVLKYIDANALDRAVLLSIYEQVFVLLALNLALCFNIKPYKYKKRQQSNLINFKFYVIITILIVFVWKIPEILQMFNSLFNDINELILLDYNLDKNTQSRHWILLFIFIFDTFRYVIPIFFIMKVNKDISNDKISVFLMILFSLLPFLAISGSNIQPFIGLAINAIFILQIKPQYKKILVITLGSIMLAAVFSMIIAKGSVLGGVFANYKKEYISITINAYVPNITNLAAMENIKYSSKWSYLISDIISTVPFRNTIMPKLSKETFSLVDGFNHFNYTQGNLVPLVGGARFYLGWILAPVAPLVIFYLSYYYEILAKQQSDLWMKFYYIYVYIRLGSIPLFYNHTSILYIYVNSLILMRLFIFKPYKGDM